MYHKQTSGGIVFIPTSIETLLASLSDGDKQTAIDGLTPIDTTTLLGQYRDGSNALYQAYQQYGPANTQIQAILTDVPDFNVSITGFTPPDLSFLK